MKKINSDLRELLLREIFEQVPLLFSGDDPLTNSQENHLSQFADRLQLLFSKGTNIDAFYKDLKELGGGSTICGRVFDKGDYYYTCIECRTDPTCVFCKDCFFNSSHVDHLYKMFASGGAGCCDCGDLEAWTKDPHCNKHKPQANIGNSDPLSSLPEWLAVHGHEFCHFIFEYTLIFQNYKDWESLPPHFKTQLEPFLKPDSYCVLTMNDEVNSFNGVVTLFIKELGVSNRDSLTMTYAIDKIGRALVSRGPQQECSQIAASLNQLNTKVLPIIIAQHQQCSVFLLNTLLSICTQTPGLQKLCAMTLFSTDFINANGYTLSEYLFSIYPNLWICACEAWMSLFLQIIIPQEDMKKILADIFLKNYEEVLRQHIENDNKHHCSLHFLSVQLFTSPSLSLFLIESSNALLGIINILENSISDKGRVTAPIKSTTIKSFKHKFMTRFYNICHDLDYLVRHPPSAEVLTEHVKIAFLEGMRAYLNVLKLFEDSDAVKRVLRIHILIELDWKELFHIQRALQPITSGFIDWLSQNKDLLLQAVNEVFEVLKQLHPPAKMKCLDDKVFSSYNCKIPVGTVSKDAVSCHIPLTRFLSGLLSACHFEEINIKTDTILKDNEMSWLFERCIRPLVLKSQVLNNFWIRNGNSVIQMITNYHSHMCKEMYYRDIYLLQLLAAHMSPDYVLLNLIKKFEVAPWFESDYSHSKKTSDVSDRDLFIQNMCEEMLGTLLTIIVERNDIHLAELTADQVMEHNLINVLFLKDWSHANLMDAIKRGNFALDYSLQNSLDSLLPKLTTDSFVSGKKRFSLKPEYYDRVCIFFYHDSKENQSDANNQLKILSQGNNKILSTLLTPPIMPNFRPHLSPILAIFEQNLFIHVLYIILDRTRNESELVSDYMAHQALFLIAIGLQEEKKGTISQFTQSLKGKNKLHFSKYDFLPILTKLSSIPSCEDIRPLIEWINSVLLPKETIHNISKEIDKRNISDKKMVEQGLLHQSRAMENLKSKQASFLERFGMADDEDSDKEIDDVIVESKIAVPIPSGGIGVYCLNLLPEQQAIGCIFCQESTTLQLLPETGKFWILPGYCTPYSGLRKGKSSIRSLSDTDAILTPASLDIGVITKSCGHSFHFTCWEQFLASSSTSHSHLVMSPEEFKCPLCYSTCNTIFPLSLSLRYNAEVSESHKQPSFEQFLNLLSLINNAKYPGEDAIKLATAFCDCFQLQEGRHNSIRFFKDNQNAFKLPSKCTEVGFVGADLKNPAQTVLALNNTINYTIQAKNNELAALEKLISNELNAHQQLVLRSIVHIAVVSMNVEFHQVYCQNANKILDALLMSLSSLDSNTFDCDAFSLLVNFQLSLPHLIAEVMNPIPNLNLSLALLPTVSPYVFKLILHFRLVQIILYTNLAAVSTDYEPDGVNRDALFKLWSLRRRTLPEQLRQTDISMKALHSEVIRLLLPFLRTASMFYNLLFNLPFPTQLVDWNEESDQLTPHEEVEILLAYVGCPGFMDSISDIFSCSTSEDLVRTWFNVSSNSSLVYAQHAQHPSQIVFPYGGLVTLPEKYTDILAEGSEYDCPITRQRAEEVVKCLVCGNCVCISCFACTETYKQTSKSNMGPFTEHMIKCSNGIGVGIWVKNACIILLSVASRPTEGTIRLTGTDRHVPYLDQYGEHDKHLRKGTPLFLYHQGYKEINQIWMQNDIPRTIEKSNEDKPHYQVLEWHSF